MEKIILIIEEHFSAIQNIAEILELANYRVVIEQNAAKGIDAIRAHKPDLILCNPKTSGMDGFSLKRLLEGMEDLKRIPFIFIADKYERFTFRRAMELGADDYLSKPFTGDELLNAISVRINRSESSSDAIVGNLQRVPEFRSMQDFRRLFGHYITKKVRKREIIYREDDMPYYLYFVMSGKVKSFKTNEFGKDYIIDIYTEDNFLGYEYLMNNKRYHDSSMAIEDSELMLIPKNDFYQLLCVNHQLSLKLIDYVSDHLCFAEEKLLKLAYNSARKRVAEALLFIHKKYQINDADNSAFSIQREDLSAISGLTVESVSRNLSCFRQEGLIETTNGTIKVIDIKKLQNLKN